MSFACFGQPGTLIFRESFGFGRRQRSAPKKRGGEDDPRSSSQPGSAPWAEFPKSEKSVTWMSIDASGVPGWNFAAATPNPCMRIRARCNRMARTVAMCFNDVGEFRAVNLMAPISSPRSKFSLSAELMPRPILGHSTSLGLTNSNVLEDNFEGSAAVWVRILAQATGVQGTGEVEFRTRGMAGQSVAMQIPVEFNGFNPVEIVVDPVALTATATVNGIVIGTLPIPSGTTKYVGFEGSGVLYNVILKLVQ